MAVTDRDEAILVGSVLVAGKTSEGKPQGHCRLKDVGRHQQDEAAKVVETAKVEPGGWVAPDSVAQGVISCREVWRLWVLQVSKGKGTP